MKNMITDDDFIKIINSIRKYPIMHIEKEDISNLSSFFNGVSMANGGTPELLKQFSEYISIKYPGYKSGGWYVVVKNMINDDSEKKLTDIFFNLWDDFMKNADYNKS